MPGLARFLMRREQAALREQIARHRAETFVAAVEHIADAGKQLPVPAWTITGAQAQQHVAVHAPVGAARGVVDVAGLGVFGVAILVALRDQARYRVQVGADGQSGLTAQSSDSLPLWRGKPAIGVPRRTWTLRVPVNSSPSASYTACR
jgi:hypothetical protein